MGTRCRHTRWVRRHLPLLDRPGSERSASASERFPPASLHRLALPSAVGIADTSDGEVALSFALALASALGALGALPHVALTALSHVPALSEQRREAFTAAGVAFSAQAIEPAGEAPALALPDGPVLVVGVPALVRFEPALSVLLEADRPSLRWPAALRGLADRIDLAIASAGLPLVRRLAEELVGTGGFLLRGDQGVR